LNAVGVVCSQEATLEEQPSVQGRRISPTPRKRRTTSQKGQKAISESDKRGMHPPHTHTHTHTHAHTHTQAHGGEQIQPLFLGVKGNDLSSVRPLRVVGDGSEPGAENLEIQGTAFF